MIRRLIEADIYNAPAVPTELKIRFWFAECRTPELLLKLAKKYPEIAETMSADRSLLYAALEDRDEELQRLLKEEE